MMPSRLMARLLPHPALSAMLVVVWLMLANAVTVGGVLIAGLLGLVLPIFTSAFWPDRPRLRFGWPMLRYVAVVLADIVVANARIAWLLVSRRNRDLRPGWLVIPLDLTTPEAITVLAATISLTPGTIAADVAADGRSLLVHALDVDDPTAEIARIKRRYEAALMQVFA